MGLNPQKTSDPKKSSPTDSYLKYSSLALQLLATIGLFGWLGHKLDQYLNLQFPVFLLTFGLIAFAGMLYQIYRSIDKS
jgi:F0F1-type ATP synthase assembly protein I